MSKTISIIGIGKVAGPVINYLSNKKYSLNLIDVNPKNLENAKSNIRKNATQNNLNVNYYNVNIKSGKIREILNNSDVVISLLPPYLHYDVAKLALATKTHFLSTSY